MHSLVAPRWALALVAGLSGASGGCVVVSTTRSAPPGSDVDAGASLDAGGRAVGADATRRVLGALGSGVILPAVRDFDAAAAALTSAVEAHAASRSDADLRAAQDAWVAAMERWQGLEMMQIGPAAMAGTAAAPGAVGGRDLRDQIDAWPLVNRCRIDQETVSRDFEDEGAFAAETVNVRGLGAMEYLLFASNASNGCGASAEINASGAWAALGEDGVRTQRARYALTLARLVQRSAVTLRAAWEPSGEDWAGQLARAGEGASAFSSAQEALNAVSDALFYLDTEVKDMKVAGPAALGDACAASSCPDLLESRWAGRSREHIAANLVAFERLFLGDAPERDAPGFDDLLVSVGAPDTASRMAEAIAAARRAAEALPRIDGSSLETHLAAFAALYDLLRTVSELMKTEVVTVLDLDLPESAATDND